MRLQPLLPGGSPLSREHGRAGNGPGDQCRGDEGFAGMHLLFQALLVWVFGGKEGKPHSSERGSLGDLNPSPLLRKQQDEVELKSTQPLSETHACFLDILKANWASP